MPPEFWSVVVGKVVLTMTCPYRSKVSSSAYGGVTVHDTVEKECGRHESVMHRHEHEAATGCIIVLCFLALQADALSLLLRSVLGSRYHHEAGRILK